MKYAVKIYWQKWFGLVIFWLTESPFCFKRLKLRWHHWVSLQKCGNNIHRPICTTNVKVKFTVNFNLNSATSWVGDNATLRPLYPWGKRRGTYCTWGWAGPRAGLHGCGNFTSNGFRPPDLPVHSKSLSLPRKTIFFSYNYFILAVTLQTLALPEKRYFFLKKENWKLNHMFEYYVLIILRLLFLKVILTC